MTTMTFSPYFHRSHFVALLMFFSIGCTHAEFDLVAPNELASHVNNRADTVIQRDPLRYQFDAVDGRLVMRINNDTDQDIALLGAQSTVVDGQGQSHPLRPQAIASHSFIKLILPPIRPHLENGPSVGIGFGLIGRAGGRDRPGLIDEGFGYGEPRYFDVVDNDSMYWDWDGQTLIRVNLTFEQQGKNFVHTFAFRRVTV